MDALLHVFDHWEDALTGAMGWMVLSAFARAMPPPLEGSFWYRWFHDGIQLFMSNWDRLRAVK